MRIDIQIPQQLDDLTLGQWQDIMGIGEVSDEFYARRIFNIIFNVNSDVITKMQANDFDHLVNSYKQVVDQKPIFKNRFTMNKIDYGFIPNLDEITFGELIDLDNNIKPEDYHKTMSILFRPITDSYKNDYKIEVYKGSHDEFKSMPLGIALGAVAFFLTLGQQLLSVILKSLKRENPELMQRALIKSGVGLSQLTPLLEGTFLNMIKLPDYKLIRHLQN